MKYAGELEHGSTTSTRLRFAERLAEAMRRSGITAEELAANLRSARPIDTVILIQDAELQHDPCNWGHLSRSFSENLDVVTAGWVDQDLAVRYSPRTDSPKLPGNLRGLTIERTPSGSSCQEAGDIFHVADTPTDTRTTTRAAGSPHVAAAHNV